MSVKQIDSNVIATAFDNVFTFNDVAKQFDGNFIDGVNLQLDLIFEEFCMETIPAFEIGCNAIIFEKDKEKAVKEAVKLLDGAVDTFVVVSGLLQKLQAAGFDVNEALLRVTENNLTKFTKKAEYIWAEKQGYEVVWNDLHSVFSYRDSNGKLRKSPEYKSVDIDDLANPFFFDGAK
jgi:hypothetical protein